MATRSTKAELRARSKSELRSLPKKQRKVVAREIAREQREADERRARRARRARQVAAGVAVVGVAAVSVLGARAWAASRNRGPLNMASDGVLIAGYGSSPYTVPTDAVAQGATPVATVQNHEFGVLDAALYVDYADPDAATLWTTISQEGSLAQNVLDGTATLEVRPIAPGGDTSATRAAAALACVAELAPDQALDANAALLAGGTDWTTEALVSALQGVGITDDAVADCVTSGRFTGWVAEATDRAAASVPYDVGSVTGTTLLLAGEAYTGAADDATAYADALDAAWAVVDAASATTDTTDSTGTDSTGTATDGTATDGTTTDGTTTDGATTDGATTDSSAGDSATTSTDGTVTDGPPDPTETTSGD